ncbi:NAD(P)H-dependent oxidoreductase subunit E [Massilia aerilata]|uniref:NAD(P)H-dependent oxidoreductase subunit E n=1 Tax=Massilia aerilata TaxID=453817 RepID=A0ABW0RYE4_9BURK
MNHPVIPIAVQGASRQRKREAPKGRRADPQALREVQDLLGDMPRRRDLLIECLHKIQDAFGALAANHLAALAQELKLAQSEVYEVASFYHHFDVLRDGEDAPASLTVRVCAGLSCEMAGASSLLDRLPAILGTDVRLQAAPCVGRCEQAPAVLVGQHPVPRATPETVLAKVRSVATAAKETTHIHTGHDGLDAYRAKGGYALLRDCAEGRRDVESVIAALEASGLRGLGGAGFPAGRKWRIVAAEPGPRLMAINIDEGEPGTFKDRVYLEHDPHRFLEGALIAAWAVGIETIYIYLRDEYHGLRGMLEAELAALRAAPPLENMPELILRRGAGAYICGEESAMIESIEGKRGMPRLRPPYVAQVGLFGRPTLEHNFETLHWVRDIVEQGPEQFASHGRHGRKGLRSFSVSGRVRDPGVKLAPAGITITELITEYCGGMQEGHQFYAYLPGGASGGILPATMGDIPLDFDTLQPYGCFIGSAAVVVLSDQDTAKAAALNTLRFFKDESCGQCTPCRAGTAKAVAIMEQPDWDIELLDDLSQVMRDASICGLGQAAPNPFDCVIKYFPHELKGGAQ